MENVGFLTVRQQIGFPKVVGFFVVADLDEMTGQAGDLVDGVVAADVQIDGDVVAAVVGAPVVALFAQ